MFADFAARFEPGSSRHVDIEKNQIDAPGAKLLERRVAAGRFRHGVAVRNQSRSHDAPDLRFVVHDEDGGGRHVPLSGLDPPEE